MAGSAKIMQVFSNKWNPENEALSKLYIEARIVRVIPGHVELSCADCCMQ